MFAFVGHSWTDGWRFPLVKDISSMTILQRTPRISQINNEEYIDFLFQSGLFTIESEWAAVIRKRQLYRYSL